MKRMEELGIIREYRAMLSPEKLARERRVHPRIGLVQGKDTMLPSRSGCG